MKQYQYPEIQMMLFEEQDILTLSRAGELGELTEIDFDTLT